MESIFRRILVERGIQPLGIIHIGAHEGEELDEYIRIGVNRVFFIEANPQVFARLVAKIGKTPGIAAANFAIADHDGEATLHVTSMSQSSSLLPFKLHSELYPEIVEVGTIQVACRRLDILLAEIGLEPTHYNLMHIDIQGAELLGLKGSRIQLIFIEALRTEVNLAELYEGCPLLDQMDQFLATCGFERAGIETPYHPTWGDAVYVGRPVVSMATLGRNGRWGNQLFQYMFLRVYAKLHGLEIQVPPWEGTPVFGFADPAMSCELVQAVEWGGPFRPWLVDALAPDVPALKRVDLVGYFQYHTSRYAPHRDFIRQLFEPIASIAAPADAALAELRSRGKTIVALHLRRGDYAEPSDQPFMYVAPNAWYLNWLESIWARLDKPVLYVASDDPKIALDDFAAYRPITATDLDVLLPEAPHYIDYHVLRHTNLVAISNSTFSFHACMLNEVAREFVRPSRASGGMVSFDPWNDEPLWRMPRG